MAVQAPDIERTSQVIRATNDIELAKILRHPFDTWIAFPHLEQRRLAHAEFVGPVKVMGSAGTGKTVVARYRADDEFWRLLAGLLGVALQSAQSNGVAHRFANAAPHLTVDPDLAWTQCLAVTKDILAERLPNTNLTPDVDLVGEAIRVGIIKPMEAVWLRESVDGQPPTIRLADAVTLMIQAVRALG